jgi:putative two-component system response regulator
MHDRPTPTLRPVGPDERSSNRELCGDGALYRLALVAERRSGESGSHGWRTSSLVDAVARRLRLPDEGRQRLRHASLLHDVGKIGIPAEILRKPAPLTADERRVVQKHAEIGFRLLAGSGSTLLELAGQVALLHHENVDGTGYPFGLSGGQIPLEARIVRVCDAFDAMTSKRPCRAALDVERALEIVMAGRGREFDAAVVEALPAALAEILPTRGIEAAA